MKPTKREIITELKKVLPDVVKLQETLTWWEQFRVDNLNKISNIITTEEMVKELCIQSYLEGLSKSESILKKLQEDTFIQMDKDMLERFRKFCEDEK